MSGGGKVVCVTGASGYVASWVVKLLLSRGYTVKATVRDPSDSKKTKHLLDLDGANERLKLFKADLTEEGSFDSAVDGCDGVFHVASPVKLFATNPQKELIDPAVKGTLNVLKSCTKVQSVKRVIVTSSMATVLFSKPTMTLEDLLDETWFSDPALCENMKMWYPLSKTLAEDAAWDFAKKNEINLIVMNPGLVIGPILHPTLNFSIEVIVDLINGKNLYNSNIYRFVDVRDVALAHIEAFETPLANGRYIMDGPVINLDEMEKIFREFYPDLRLTQKNGVEHFPVHYKVNLEKVKSLGIEFTPPEVSLRDTIISLQEKGFLQS